MWPKLLRYSIILGIVSFLIQAVFEKYKPDSEMLILITAFAFLFILLGFWIGYSWRDKIIVNYRKQLYFSKLSEREREVAELILMNFSNKEIIAELNVEHSTLKTHINQIYKKCSTKTRKEFKTLFLPN